MKNSRMLDAAIYLAIFAVVGWGIYATYQSYIVQPIGTTGIPIPAQVFLQEPDDNPAESGNRVTFRNDELVVAKEEAKNIVKGSRLVLYSSASQLGYEQEKPLVLEFIALSGPNPRSRHTNPKIPDNALDQDLRYVHIKQASKIDPHRIFTIEVLPPETKISQRRE